MKVALASLLFLIAAVLLGYLIVGWGSTIQVQGLEAALTDQTTQPSLPATLSCSVLGIGLLIAGLSLLRGGNKE